MHSNAIKMHEIIEIMSNQIAWNPMKSYEIKEIIKFSKIQDFSKIEDFIKFQRFHEIMKCTRFDEITWNASNSWNDELQPMKCMKCCDYAWICLDLIGFDWTKISWNAKDFSKIIKCNEIQQNHEMHKIWWFCWNCWNCWNHDFHKISWNWWATDGSGFKLFCTSCCVKQSKAKFYLLCFVLLNLGFAVTIKCWAKQSFALLWLWSKIWSFALLWS